MAERIEGGPFPARHPFFEFYIGGSAGSPLYIKFHNGTLLCEQPSGDRFSGEVLTLAMDPEAWAAFCDAAERIGVWDWEPEYEAPHGCCDVTYWYLRMEAAGRTVSSRGADAYPGADSLGTSRPFREFQKAVKELIDQTGSPDK